MKSRPLSFSGPMVVAIRGGRKFQTRRIAREPMPWHGCVTGDCPHAKQTECDAALRALSPYGQIGDRLWVRETWTADFGHTFSDQVGAWWHEVPKSLRTEAAVEMLYYRADTSCYHRPEQPDDDARFGSDIRRSTWTPTDDDLDGIKWRSSRLMPRWASRMTLEIVDVRVEWLRDIKPEDAIREGYPYDGVQELSPQEYVMWFRELWDSLNEDEGRRWKANPLVWVISFKVLP